MSRRKRKDLRKKNEAKSNIAILFSAIIAVIMIGSAGYFVFTRPEVNAVTNCIETESQETALIIIDRTGPFSENHIRAIKDLINYEIEGLSYNYKVQIHSLDEQYSGLSETLFEQCKPKSKDEMNLVYENVHLAAEKTRLFENEIIDNIDHISQKEDSKISPILEALNDAISLENSSTLQVHKIILVSDLLQHTSSLSFYKNNPQNVDFNQSIKKLLPSLKTVDMTVYLLERHGLEGQRQTPALISWWEQAFELANVNSLTIHKVRN